MNLKIFSIALCLAMGAGYTSVSYAKGDKREYDALVSQAKAKYKEDQKACDKLSGNARDICMEEASAAEKKARADARARYKGTERAAYQARVDYAKADYEVAQEKCDDKSGNDKDICIKAAKDVKVKALADARAAHKSADARQEANQDKRRADYKLEVEKCDSLSGAAKDACVANAKTRYNM